MFKKRKEKALRKNNWKNEEVISERIIVSHPMVTEKVKMLRLSKEDLYFVAYVKPLVETHIDGLVNEFYEQFFKYLI
ncbi:hypothetical protein J27TS8_17700 [Robertmurraya siralis]|uniref:Uncharacterized protein n=1 Tax=Robertmurraya siralis TaxID=77777 RepID=A0A920BTZ9_9BACI|nr:hypothetical protein [Robertmurraya siralis]GIN61777.1 hypothetical protein J27TS8_17700 [Robertmurraya siralis]